MDYEGNYFPDEEDERSSKAARRTKKALHCFFYAAVAIVYIVVLAVLLNNCEPDIYKDYAFSPDANKLYEADPEGFEVYKLFPPVFMSYDGAVQIAAPAYSPTASELELGIKYNSSLKSEEDGAPPRFELKDTDGRVYPVCNSKSGKKGRYCYLRLSFSGVRLRLDENPCINPEASAAAEGEGEMYETFSLFLEIHRPNGDGYNGGGHNDDGHKGSGHKGGGRNDSGHKGGEDPERITVYNNATPIGPAKFR